MGEMAGLGDDVGMACLVAESFCPLNVERPYGRRGGLALSQGRSPIAVKEACALVLDVVSGFIEQAEGKRESDLRRKGRAAAGRAARKWIPVLSCSSWGNSMVGRGVSSQAVLGDVLVLEAKAGGAASPKH